MAKIHQLWETKSTAKRGHRAGLSSRHVRHRAMFAGAESSSRCLDHGRSISRSNCKAPHRKGCTYSDLHLESFAFFNVHKIPFQLMSFSHPPESFSLKTENIIVISNEKTEDLRNKFIAFMMILHCIIGTSCLLLMNLKESTKRLMSFVALSDASENLRNLCFTLSRDR